MKAIRSSFSFLALSVSLLGILLAGCGGSNASTTQTTTVNLGYFPNLTHEVALVGAAKGIFANALGSNVKLKTTTFNAGPNLIEALLGKSIDIGYVGPNPAINGYTQSNGAALRVIAGASSGGAIFVVRPEANIQTAQDLANKKLATPQLGGTQDVALRYYLQQNGLKTSDKGGNVQVTPTDNANILTLFKSGKIDGAWVPEPWATRLIVEAKGKVFIDERTQWDNGKFATTIVVVRKAFADEHPDIVKKFLQGHVDAVQYIQDHQDDALKTVDSEIKRITGTSSVPLDELKQAAANLDITYDPLASTISKSADRAYSLGFIKTKPDLVGLYSLQELNAVLTTKGLAQVTGP